TKWIWTIILPSAGITTYISQRENSESAFLWLVAALLAYGTAAAGYGLAQVAFDSRTGRIDAGKDLKSRNTWLYILQALQLIGLICTFAFLVVAFIVAVTAKDESLNGR